MPNLLITEAREPEQSKKSEKKGPVQVMVDDLAIPVPQFGVANSTSKLKELLKIFHSQLVLNFESRIPKSSILTKTVAYF